MPSEGGCRVLMVARWAPPSYSGAGQQALALAQELARNGHRITVFTASGRRSLLEHERVGGLEVVRWRATSRHPWVAKALFLTGLTAHLTSRPRRYDVVHLHGSYFVLRLLRLLKRPLRYAIVYKPTMIARDDPAAIELVRPSVLACVDSWICVVAEITASGLRTGIPAEKLVSLPNGVDLARFAPPSDADKAALRAELLLPERRIWALVASMIPRKRIHLAVEAWALLRRPRPLLVVVGPLDGRESGVDPTYADEVRQLVESAGLRDDVSFMDRQEAVERVLHAVDGFVFTSEREGLPNAVLEALAAGLPVVTTGFQAIDDLLVLADGRMRVVDPNPSALAEAIAATTYDRVVPASIASVSLQKIAARYDAVYRHARANGAQRAEAVHA